MKDLSQQIKTIRRAAGWCGFSFAAASAGAPGTPCGGLVNDMHVYSTAANPIGVLTPISAGFGSARQKVGRRPTEVSANFTF